ncbi:MAG: PAS domain S-box protein [Halioglobus sp.]|nr:PAS domain S-box protein [Halioglobus sp.]
MAGLVVIAFFSIAWHELDKREREDVARASQAKAQHTAFLIQQDLDNRVFALTELANHDLLSDDSPGREGDTNRDSIVRKLMQVTPGYLAIQWADASLRAQWSITLPQVSLPAGQDLLSNPDVLAVAKAARQTGRGLFTPPISLDSGQRVILACIPTYSGDAFSGLMVGVLALDLWLDAVLLDPLQSDYAISILVDDQRVFPLQSSALPKKSAPASTTLFVIHNLRWQVNVAPKADVAFVLHKRLSIVLLALSLLISVLATVLVYFTLTSYQRTRQLKVASRELKRLVKNLPGLSYRSAVGFPWPIEFASPGCRALCGYEADELMQHRVFWGHLIHRDDLQYVKDTVQQGVARGRPFEMEYRILTREGCEKWVWERGSIFTAKNTEEIQLEGFITDITSQKQTQISLEREQSYSRAIVDAAFEAVVSVRTDGCIQTFNRAAQNMFGYRADEIIGSQFGRLLAQCHQLSYQSHREQFSTNDVAKLVFHSREVTARRKNGEEFPAQLSVNEMRYEHQPQRTFICLISDISLQRRAEEQARQHFNDLARADRLHSLGEMASGIAHEINQPLTAISLFSQVGNRFVQSQQYHRLPEIFDKLSAQANHAGSIIEHMQNMTRQQDAIKQPINCNVAVSEVIALVEAESRLRDIPVDMQLAEGLPLVLANSVQIQQVVLNLLRNGMESMVAAGCTSGTPITVITRQHGGGDVEIAIVDSGIGVDDETAQTLFKPFATSKQSGMGLGLAISREIVAAHGGELRYENNAAGGATFSFTLPAVQ